MSKIVFNFKSVHSNKKPIKKMKASMNKYTQICIKINCLIIIVLLLLFSVINWYTEFVLFFYMILKYIDSERKNNDRLVKPKQ